LVRRSRLRLEVEDGELTMSERPRATLVHSSAGRARLHIDNRRGDERFFSEAAAVIVEHPAVREVRASSRAGSLLILHNGELEPVLAHAKSRELFEVEANPTTPMRRVRESIDQLDDTIAKHTGDSLNLGKVMFVALVGAGLWQAKKGYVLPASLTVFNYALKAMEWVNEREVSISSKRH
jgi:hypothetical protein